MCQLGKKLICHNTENWEPQKYILIEFIKIWSNVEKTFANRLSILTLLVKMICISEIKLRDTANIILLLWSYFENHAFRELDVSYYSSSRSIKHLLLLLSSLLWVPYSPEKLLVWFHVYSGLPNAIQQILLEWMVVMIWVSQIMEDSCYFL